MLSTLRKFSRPVATIGLMAILAGSAQAQSWQLVSPAGSGFSIQMPGTPEASTSNISTVIGPVPMHMYMISSAAEAYFVAYSDFPTNVDVQRCFDGARDSAFANGRVYSESNTSLNGYPGRAIVGTKDGFRATLRMYIANGRFYQVLYLSQGSSSLPQTAVAFFDSFRILR
jgi:hypothetical protein